MAMEQIGYVSAIENGIAKIRVERESACGGNCGACHGCPSTAVFVTYPDDKDRPFRVGETVKVLMPTGKFFGGMMKSYGILIITVIVGAILGYCVNFTEGFSVLGAFLGLLVGGVVVHILSKKSHSGIVVKRIDRKEELHERTETN